MIRTKHSHIKQISGLEKYDSFFLQKIFKSSFESQKGFGFLDTEVYQSIITSTLIYETIISQKIFSPDENRFTISNQVHYQSVPFSIDLTNGVLDSSFGGDRFRKLVSVLNNLFQLEISFQDIFIDLKKFLYTLPKGNFVYNITGVAINNFRPDVGLSGRFIATVFEQTSIYNLLSQNEVDLTNLETNIIYDGSNSSWKISTNGNFSIRADEQDMDTFYNLIKNLISECKNA